MATLYVPATQSFVGASLSDIDTIEFTAGDNVLAYFSSTQFDGIQIHTDVVLTGNSQSNRTVVVFVDGLFDASAITSGSGVYLETRGGDGDDVIIGAALAERSEGNDGNDTFIGSAYGDYLLGGDGIDLVSYQDSPEPVRVDLRTNAPVEQSSIWSHAYKDRLFDIENVIGSNNADTLIGNDLPNTLLGLDHNDWLIGGVGPDVLDGGAGIDTAVYRDSDSAITVSLVTGGSGGTAEGDILGNIENLVGSDHGDFLSGAAEANTLTGGAGNDTLRGLGGNDRLEGEDGEDNAQGGEGNDTISGADGNDVMDGEAGNDVLNGSIGNDLAFGQSGNDWMAGWDGNDTLIGGAGVDSMYGGAGDDTYFVDAAGDVADEGYAFWGADTVNSAVDFTLGPNLENLVLVGNAMVGTGNAESNAISGTSGNNTLFGLGGNDTLTGGDGNDSAAGGTGVDVITLGAGADTGVWNKGDGNDTFDLGTGYDTLLAGGSENADYFQFDRMPNGNFRLMEGGGAATVTITGTDALDQFRIRPLGGADYVVLRADEFTPARNVIVDLTADGAIDDVVVQGTAVGEYIVVTGATGPGGGSVSVFGFGGSMGAGVTGAESSLDRLTVEGGAGNDYITAYDEIGFGELAPGLMQVTFFGGNGIDTLLGAGGSETLNGGAGADSMNGGGGNDTYVVDNLGDIVTESVAGPSGGTDTIESSITFSLASRANVERLTLLGSSAIHGTGNNLANLIIGNNGINRLTGGSGNDTMHGGGGKDVLIGGKGNDSMDGGAAADTFRFAVSNTGNDRIAAYSIAEDRFDLAGGSFTAMLIVGSDTRLIHAGGSVTIEGISHLTLAQWNARVLPAGGVASANESGASDTAHVPTRFDVAFDHGFNISTVDIAALFARFHPIDAAWL